MSCTGKSREKWLAGAAVLICGLVTHGYILTNKISYHDDSVNYFGVGTTFESGRWALGLIQKFLTKIDFFNYSSSWWNGLLSILLVAVCAMILSELFQIKHTGYAVLVGVLLISFPAMTSLFAYMFTAPYYMFAVLLMISAVYMTVKYSYGFLPAIIMMGFSMGIYQTYFGVATTLFVLILVSDAETRNFIENIKEAFKYLLTLLGGILCYFLGNTICIRNFHVTLLDYQGINDMADVTVKSLIGSVKNAYIGFLQPILGEFCGISNQKAVRILYLAVYLMVGVLVLRRLCKRGMELWNRIYFFVLCCLIPLSISIIYVMAVSDKTVIHTLMIYPYVFGLIYPIVLLEKENLKGKFWKGISVFYCTVAILLSIYYIRLDNIAYLKANYQHIFSFQCSHFILQYIRGADRAGLMERQEAWMTRFQFCGGLMIFSCRDIVIICMILFHIMQVKNFWNYIVAILIRNLRIGRRLLQVKIFRRCLVIHAMVP